MLLPLLGACAVLGPFQGPEWEPVQALLPQDRSCRDPRCRGNLLVLCLFLIWQVQHYWRQVIRTRPSRRNVIKVPPQKWAVPSMRHETFFRPTPEFFFSPGNCRGLDAHVQQWTQKERWGYQRRLQESWAQYLLSSQHLSQGLPWGAHTHSEPIFCTASFSSTCLLPQGSSWKARQVPWCLSDGQTHPALDMCQNMEPLLVCSQGKLVPKEPVISMRSCPTSLTLATSLPNLPSAQRLQFCPREFLPDPSNQLLRMRTWKSWDCPQEAWAPGGENQTIGSGDSREIQAPEWVSQRESRGKDAWEMQASGRQLPIAFGMEDDAETKVLGYENQRLVSETDGEILTAGWEKQDQMGVKDRAKIQELGKRNPRQSGSKNPPETQAHMGENQEHLKCKTDAETQTPEWENQGKNGDEDAVERKNKKQARGEDEGEIQAQGLGKQGQTGGENSGETQMQQWGKQDQIGGDTGAGIQTEEGRNKDQVGGEDAVQTPSFRKENLGEVKKEDGVETQALEWGKQEYIGSEEVTEIQTPGWEKQDQGGSEKAWKTQTFRGENQKLLKHEIQLGWENQGLGRDKNAEETQIMSRKKLKEIREEDWVVIQALCWGNQTLVASEIHGQFEIPCWGNQNEIGGEHRAEIQAPEKTDQRKDGDEDGTNTLAPEAKNQEQLRGVTDTETHPAGRKNQEQFGDDSGTDIQALGPRNLRGVKGEDDKETQEHGEEDQGQLGNEFNGKVHLPKWKNQEHFKGKDGTNTQTSEAENWGELTSKIDGETHSAGWKKEEQIGGENGAEIQIQGKRNLSEVRGKDGAEIWAPGKENLDRKMVLSEWKNQEQMGGETGTETQAPEKRNQREPGGEDDVKNQSPESKNREQLSSETGGSHSPGRRNWEQTGGKNVAENQASEKRNQREVGSEDGRKIQRLREKNQRLLKSKVNGESCSLEWKNQEQIGGGNDEESQIQGKRNLRGTTGDDGTETQALGREDQGQLRSEIDGEIQAGGQGYQKEGGDEDAAELQDVGRQRKCRAEDAGEPRAPRGGSKDQVRGKDTARASLQVDYSGSEGPTGRKHSPARPPAFTGSGYGATELEQTVAVNSVVPAPCPEKKPLTGQATAPARQKRVGVSPASQQGIQARSESQRRRQRDKRVVAEKASSPTGQPWSRVPSACPPLLCAQAPEAATALVGALTAFTVPPKWPVLKKSKHLLLESLMKRRIAHLKWGLPRRILESYLLFHFLGSYSLPLAGVRFPGLYTGQEPQGQQERHCEAQDSMPSPKSPEKSQRVQPPGGKSSTLPMQARALEKYRPDRSEPRNISTPPEKPRRVRPPGGARDPQEIQEAALRAKLPAPRNPRPAAESRSWCGGESFREPSSENRRGRKMVRPGVSQMAERPPSRVRTSSSRAGHDPCMKECTSWEASQPPRPKCQQPTYWRRGSVEPAEGREAGQQPSSDSTETVSVQGSFHSAAARLEMTLLNKMSWSPQPAKPHHSDTHLSLREPDPTLLPKLGDPQAEEDSIGDHTALERDLQPPGHRCAGATFPKTKSPQGQMAPGNSHGVRQNLPASKKFGFMKHLRFSLFHCGFKK